MASLAKTLALDSLVKLNLVFIAPLFTTTVMVATLQHSLEEQLKWKLVFFLAISLGCFLSSALMASALKLKLNTLDIKDVNMSFIKLRMLFAVAWHIVGYIFAVLFWLNTFQNRGGSDVRGVNSLIVLVSSLVLFSISAILYAFSY